MQKTVVLFLILFIGANAYSISCQPLFAGKLSDMKQKMTVHFAQRTFFGRRVRYNMLRSLLEQDTSLKVQIKIVEAAAWLGQEEGGDVIKGLLKKNPPAEVQIKIVEFIRRRVLLNREDSIDILKELLAKNSSFDVTMAVLYGAFQWGVAETIFKDIAANPSSEEEERIIDILNNTSYDNVRRLPSRSYSDGVF